MQLADCLPTIITPYAVLLPYAYTTEYEALENCRDGIVKSTPHWGNTIRRYLVPGLVLRQFTGLHPGNTNTILYKRSFLAQLYAVLL